jgi:WD40 repeat protein
LFELLTDAVALSQSALSFHPGQLRAQLIGRLAGCVEPSVVKLLEQARDVGSALVPPKTLIPRHQCMNRAGQGRIRLRWLQDTWVSSVALLGDGSVLVSGGYDCSVRVWSLPGGEPMKVMQGHRHAVRAVAVSADGLLAASGSEDRTVVTWDLEKGERTLELLGHRAAVRAVCLTPVGHARGGDWGVGGDV